MLRELQVNFLIKFLTSYDEWTANLLKLESSDFEADERMIVPAKDDKLMHSTVSRKFLSLLENNFSDKEALDLLALILSTASKASGVQFSALKPQKLPRHMPQENNLWRLKL